MKNDSLNSLLKQARTPEIPADSLETFPREVLLRLKTAETRQNRVSRATPRLLWGWGIAFAAGILVTLTLGQMSGWTGKKPGPPEDALANLTLIRQTMSLFPNRLRAIVQDERGLSVVLSDKDDVAVSSPIYIHICDGKHCDSVVTFSGQEIEVGGRKLTVLSDTQGGVILAGDHFVWSSREPLYAGNPMKIEGRSLANPML